LVVPRGICALGAVAAAVGGLARAAIAEAPPPPADPPPWAEVWSGAETFHGFWSIYSGATVAPFGSVREDGFRLRGVAGTGDFGTGTASAGDILVGYHKQLGAVTIKVFGGFTIVQYRPDPGEAWPALKGVEYGAKGVLEAWWNISDQAWASLDLSMGSTHLEYGSRVRLGWRVWPELSAGFEGGSGGTAETALERDTSRVGAFLRYEWETGEVSLSGGWAMDGTWQERDGAAGAFGTISVLTRY
jgi:hypothetical protein